MGHRVVKFCMLLSTNYDLLQCFIIPTPSLIGWCHNWMVPKYEQIFVFPYCTTLSARSFFWMLSNSPHLSQGRIRLLNTFLTQHQARGREGYLSSWVNSGWSCIYNKSAKLWCIFAAWLISMQYLNLSRRARVLCVAGIAALLKKMDNKDSPNLVQSYVFCTNVAVFYLMLIRSSSNA
jgi:hypothetical protein